MNLAYEIHQPAHISSLEILRTFVQDTWFRFHLDPDFAPKLDLVMEEILINVIKYAYPEQTSEGYIHICCGMPDTDWFCVQIEDQGIPFNMLESKHPDTSQDIHERPIGGLGIHLVKNLSDSIEYKRVDNTNILTVCFALKK